MSLPYDNGVILSYGVLVRYIKHCTAVLDVQLWY